MSRNASMSRRTSLQHFSVFLSALTARLPSSSSSMSKERKKKKKRKMEEKQHTKHFFSGEEENGLLERCQVELSVNFFEIGLMCHLAY